MTKRPRDAVWQDYCETCNKSGGMLLCCDACPRSFHLTCVGLSSMPAGEWLCSMCCSSLSVEVSEHQQNQLDVLAAAPSSTSTASVPSAAPAVHMPTETASNSDVTRAPPPAQLMSSCSTSSDAQHVLAVQRSGDALRTVARAELSHVSSELIATEEKLTAAHGEVARLEAERSALEQRREHLQCMLEHLHALAPPAPELGEDEIAPPPTAESVAPPPAATGAAGKSANLPFGRELSRPGRVRTVALWHPACLKHAPSPSCPEQPTRLRAVVSVLEEIAAQVRVS